MAAFLLCMSHTCLLTAERAMTPQETCCGLQIAAGTKRVEGTCNKGDTKGIGERRRHIKEIGLVKAVVMARKVAVRSGCSLLLVQKRAKGRCLFGHACVCMCQHVATSRGLAPLEPGVCNSNCMRRQLHAQRHFGAPLARGGTGKKSLTEAMSTAPLRSGRPLFFVVLHVSLGSNPW